MCNKQVTKNGVNVKSYVVIFNNDPQQQTAAVPRGNNVF